MTTTEFIRKFAAEWNVTVTDAEGWIRPIFEFLGQELVNNTRIRLSKCGTFEQVCSAPRVGRNMNTGERIEIPSRITVEFKPTETIDEALRALPPVEELTKAAKKKAKRLPKRTVNIDVDGSSEQ